MLRAAAVAVPVALAASACVVGASRPPSRLETARAPIEPLPRDAVTAREAGFGCAAPAEAAPARPSPDFVWIAGECRAFASRYVWVPGHWERLETPYSWR